MANKVDIHKRAEIIAMNLQEAIVSSGYTYGALEKMTGLSGSTIQRYATAQTKKIPIVEIEIIAKAIGIDPIDILGWNKNSFKDIVNNNGRITEKEAWLEFQKRRPKDGRDVALAEALKDIGLSGEKLELALVAAYKYDSLKSPIERLLENLGYTVESDDQGYSYIYSPQNGRTYKAATQALEDLEKTLAKMAEPLILDSMENAEHENEDTLKGNIDVDPELKAARPSTWKDDEDDI